MSFGIAVRFLDIAGGRQLAGHITPWTVEGESIVCLGDPVEPHMPSPPHATSPIMEQGSNWFTFDGVLVCQGHLANCCHATTGRGWWTLPD